MKEERVTAVAHANIALVKYWGKRPGEGNLPAVGSLSIGLEALAATTRLAFADGADSVLFNGEAAAPDKTGRILGYLDLWRRRFGADAHFAVDTRNNFPTGAGLASSAAGFAALALALDRLLGVGLGEQALSQMARQGSGSAARSIFGGFVELQLLGEDPAAKRLMSAEDWPLEVLVAITDASEKPLGSTEAMRRTAATSPYYDAWVASHPDDLARARGAVLGRDFSLLAEVAEHNCLKMHAALMSSNPPIVYWSDATLAVMHRVRQVRADGLAAFFTVDAGPQVKVVCDATALTQVREQLVAIPGVREVIHSAIGGEPEIVLEKSLDAEDTSQNTLSLDTSAAGA
ncbi:MAG: diphosphomevalonate decarboxylase [Pseudomonadales bacterium]